MEMSMLLRYDRERKLFSHAGSLGFSADGWVPVTLLAEAMDNVPIWWIREVCQRSIRKNGVARFETVDSDTGITLVRALDADGKHYAKDVARMVWENYMRNLPETTALPQDGGEELSGPPLPDQVPPTNGVAMPEEELGEEWHSETSERNPISEIQRLQAEIAGKDAEIQELKSQLDNVLKGVRFVAKTSAEQGLTPTNSAMMARTWYAQACSQTGATVV